MLSGSEKITCRFHDIGICSETYYGMGVFKRSFIIVLSCITLIHAKSYADLESTTVDRQAGQLTEPSSKVSAKKNSKLDLELESLQVSLDAFLRDDGSIINGRSAIEDIRQKIMALQKQGYTPRVNPKHFVSNEALGEALKKLAVAKRVQVAGIRTRIGALTIAAGIVMGFMNNPTSPNISEFEEPPPITRHDSSHVSE